MSRRRGLQEQLHKRELHKATGMNVAKPSAQIIGLAKNRLSGIVLSRHDYAKVLRNIFPDLLDAEVNYAKQNPCKVNVWAARPLSHKTLDEFQKLDGLNVWCLVTESTILPFRSHEAADNSDQIWVPSKFVEKTLVDSGIDRSKIFLVPYKIYHPTFEERYSIHQRQDRKMFKVLMMWDGASNFHRKGVIEGIQMFKKAFRSMRNVQLYLKTRDLRPPDKAELETEIDNDSRIIVDDSFVPNVNDVFSGTDVLLHPHKAEGYGRCVIEACLREIPVVATGYSGPNDWLDSSTGYPISFTMEETSPQEFRYPQGGMWAKPNVDHGAEELHSLYLQKSLDGSCRSSVTKDALIRSKDWSSEENSLTHMRKALLAAGLEV